ncbi:WD40-repeat-containing domain protein [Rhizoctonia solani]|nr:WD40-repeat-containing domain protein [Rhizoctonia solani]
MASIENDSTFVAPEGVYSLTEEYKPPPIHATTAGIAASFHSKLTTITVKFTPPKAGSQGLTSLLGGKAVKEKKKEDEGPASGESDHELEPEVEPDLDDPSTPQQQQQLFSPTGLKPGPLTPRKKSVARPKNNIKTTSSSFVTRLHTMEGLSKHLAAKSGDVTFMFYNAGKSFYWMDVSGKLKEPLARISFSQFPTCHAVNTLTSSSTCLDIVIGFNTGISSEPLSSRYVRINKQVVHNANQPMNLSPCTQVRWVPSSATLLLASYADGTIVVYDTERQDAAFVPHDPSKPMPPPPSGSASTGSERMWDPLNEILVTSNTGSDAKNLKNPVSHWRLTEKKSVVGRFRVFPDVRYVAAISEDGCLRIIDALSETLMDVYQAYFGALTCLAWSPDGRYILTGGQDDLVTRIVARCQGHLSFVSSVAFDACRIDSRTYRFGSVGEDNRLIFWDLSSGALHKPKLHPSHALSSTLSLALRRSHGNLVAGGIHQGETDRFHPAPSRMEVATIQPVVVKPIDGEHLLAHVSFLSSAVMTMTRTGLVKQWVRPWRSRRGSSKGLGRK